MLQYLNAHNEIIQTTNIKENAPLSDLLNFASILRLLKYLAPSIGSRHKFDRLMKHLLIQIWKITEVHNHNKLFKVIKVLGQI